MNRTEIMGYTYDMAKRMGVPLDSIFFSDMEDKWAFLKRKWNRITEYMTYFAVTFSNCLTELPPECEGFVKYLVVHELAHVKTHEHGSRFWSIVAKYCPRYLEYEDMVKFTPNHDCFIITSGKVAKYVQRAKGHIF